MGWGRRAIQGLVAAVIGQVSLGDSERCLSVDWNSMLGGWFG